MQKAACCSFLPLQSEFGDHVSKLANAMAAWVKQRMAAEIVSLPSGSRECRAVFCAPPSALLAEVFQHLAGDGSLLTAISSDGDEISYPVVLQLEEVPPGLLQAGVHQSGVSSFHGLASLRNDP